MNTSLKDVPESAASADSGQALTRAFAIVGSGGAGALTAGNLLLDGAARAGWYGLLTRSVGPQIRGGEAAALLRLGERSVQCPSDRFDVLVALDWANADRFAAEIPLGADSIIIADPDHGEIPPVIAEAQPQVYNLPLNKLAKAVPKGRINMVAVGIVAELVGLSDEILNEVLEAQLGRKGAEALSASLAAVATGRTAAADLPRRELTPVSARPKGRWLITGNQAAGLGALRGGVRFVAAYPITPATEVLEWLAARLPAVGGNLVQAEDELASINMIIGASFGGVPALTATSGPGLALMTESIGLAVSAEIPVVIIDVMRGGPSTGIPTKSEQSDLNMALYGLHGDAPHLVLAPTGIADCVHTTQWAVYLAEALQAPAIVLSDQSMGQARAVIDAPADLGLVTRREIATHPGADYRRYAITDSGVSPMSIPGTPGGAYVADGLEHTVSGMPSSRAEDHTAQLDKRAHKLEQFDFGERWADIQGNGDLAVITWGSLAAPVREALERLAADGMTGTRMISIRLLAPAQPQRFAEALRGVRRVLIIEQTHSGQFHRYLRAHFDLPGTVEVLHRAGPMQFRPGEIYQHLKHWSEQ